VCGRRIMTFLFFSFFSVHQNPNVVLLEAVDRIVFVELDAELEINKRCGCVVNFRTRTVPHPLTHPSSVSVCVCVCVCVSV